MAIVLTWAVLLRMAASHSLLLLSIPMTGDSRLAVSSADTRSWDEAYTKRAIPMSRFTAVQEA